ncbi:MAG: hypothetical protein LBB85_12290 [Dysgonamonadaceae bacterium]|jgi:hypothetical protein|nr:hypothetical protein [Dysgonamonadaceae bacterium]
MQLQGVSFKLKKEVSKIDNGEILPVLQDIDTLKDVPINKSLNKKINIPNLNNEWF